MTYPWRPEITCRTADAYDDRGRFNAHMREALQRLDDAGLGGYRDTVGALCKQGVRIHPEPAANTTGLRHSRFGGAPDVPADFAWPTTLLSGEEYTFLGQINLAEIAALGLELPLPTTGLLSFFAEPLTLYDQEGQLFYFADDVELTPSEPGRFAPASLRFEREVSYPHPFALVANEGYVRLNNVLGDDEPAYEELLRSVGQHEFDAPQHRLLGNPNIIQADDPAAPGTTTLVLQLDTDRSLDWTWDDGGRLWFLADGDALDRRDFSAIGMLSACY
jgi:uncharacterized protein YwqG